VIFRLSDVGFTQHTVCRSAPKRRAFQRVRRIRVVRGVLPSTSPADQKSRVFLFWAMAVSKIRKIPPVPIAHIGKTVLVVLNSVQTSFHVPDIVRTSPRTGNRAALTIRRCFTVDVNRVVSCRRRPGLRSCKFFVRINQCKGGENALSVHERW
jgi:hypothetical protein